MERNAHLLPVKNALQTLLMRCGCVVWPLRTCATVRRIAALFEHGKHLGRTATAAEPPMALAMGVCLAGRSEGRHGRGVARGRRSQDRATLAADSDTPVSNP